MRFKAFQLGTLHVAWQVSFFLVPIFFLLLLSLKKFEMGIVVDDFCLSNYYKLLHSNLIFISFLRTFAIGLSVSLLATLFALITVLGTWNFKMDFIKQLLLITCSLVFFVGLIPRVFVLSLLLSENGPLNQIVVSLGFSQSLFLNYTIPGIILSYLSVMTPLSLLLTYVARNDVPEDIIFASNELGSGWFATQLRITIPLMKTGIVVSLSLIFILTIADITIVDIIGGSKLYTSASFILDLVKIDDWGMGAAASILFLIPISLYLLIINVLFSKFYD